MPYLRDRSTRFQVRRRNLPGVGDTGVLSTGTANRQLAERMERAFLDVAERALYEPSYRAVVDAVVARRLSLADLLAAHSRGQVGALRTALVDPPLAEACARYVAKGEGLKKGRLRPSSTRLLLDLAPARARLSWLRDSANVEAALYAAERGEPGRPGDGGAVELTPRMRNTVRRGLLRAVSHVLRAEVGQAERDRVITAVDFPAEDDTREVALSADDVGRLLGACAALHVEEPRAGYGELAVAVRLMIQTSADRGVVFAGGTGAGVARGLRVSQVRVYAEPVDEGAGPGPSAERYAGEVYLDDQKAVGRARTVSLTDGMCRALLPLCVGKRPDEPVFALSYRHARGRWERARARAGLPDLRMKDLRAQFAIHAERAGVPLTVVSSAMGHSDALMTRRYQRHQAALTGEHAAAVERELGLTGP